MRDMLRVRGLRRLIDDVATLGGMVGLVLLLDALFSLWVE